MRDTIRPNGLRSCILEIISEIPEYKKDIDVEKRDNIKEGLKRMLFTMLLEKTIAHYSVGDDKATVTRALIDTIAAFEEAFNYDTGGDYDDAIWLISLGVLCDLPLDTFKRITNVLARDGVNDTLISTIIKYKQPDWEESAAAVLWEKPYARIVNVQDANGLRNYLDKYWYQENEDSYWHGLHNNTKVNNYFGYWSWEAAALAKIREIDDTPLKNQKYYPYDAVHW